MKTFEKKDKNLFSSFLWEVVLVDVLGQKALLKIYNNDDLTLFLGLLVATNVAGGFIQWNLPRIILAIKLENVIWERCK